MTLGDLAARARDLAADGRVVLGVAGAPGAGKSTLVAALLDRLGEDAAHVPMDGFHLSNAQLARLGLRDRKGAPETFDAAGYVALLRRVLSERETEVYAPGYERTLEEPVAAALVVPPRARVVLTEGNYLLLPRPPWDAVPGLCAEVWFCDAEESRRLDQLTRRHVAFGKAPDAAAAWAAGPDAANAVLVRATRDRADLVVDEAVLRALAP